MKLGLINSAWMGTSVGTEAGIRATREIGFDTIDIFADPLETGVKDRRLIRETVKRERLPVISVICCALGIADFNAPVRAFHVSRAKSTLELGYELEARNLLLVLGEYIWNREVIAPGDQWKWAVDGVRQLAIHAESLGLELAIEIEPFELSIVNRVEGMCRFLEDVGHPAARANLDISHLVLAHDGPEQIARLSGKIAHVHLSDCDGKTHGDMPPRARYRSFHPLFRGAQRHGLRRIHQH